MRRRVYWRGVTAAAIVARRWVLSAVGANRRFAVAASQKVCYYEDVLQAHGQCCRSMEFTDYDTRIAAYAVIIDQQDRILLSWYNGRGRGEPGWTLPGGGVEYTETAESAVVREVLEETGYSVETGRLLTVHTFTLDSGPDPARPYK